MEIVLVRHGQPEWTRDGVNIVDPPLTELGHRQAELLAQRLVDADDTRYDEIYSSPLLRTRQTAQPVFSLLGREPAISAWLEEIRDPAWHGTPAERAELAFRELRQRPVDQRWEGLDGGESVRDFTDRIHRGATEFFAERGVRRLDHDLPLWSIEHPEQRIVLIAHAGTNSVTIAHLLGLPATPWEWDRFVLGHTSVSRLEAIPVHDAFTFSLTSLSNLEHLAPHQRTR